MKIRVKIPDHIFYPEKYRGKETVIDVSNIIFDDGCYWNISPDIVSAQPELVFEPIAGNIELMPDFKPISLSTLIGNNPTKITMEF